MKSFIAFFTCICIFVSLATAQNKERRPAQKWMAGTAFTGIRNGTDSAFSSVAAMPQLGIGFRNRFYVGVSAQFFRRYTEGFPRVNTWQTGLFLRWYPVAGNRWALSPELAWLVGNHYDYSDWTLEGPKRRSGQQAVHVGFNGEFRLYGPLWLEASFIINRVRKTDFNNFLSLGLNAHFGK
jgi:hypothetical protein